MSEADSPKQPTGLPMPIQPAAMPTVPTIDSEVSRISPSDDWQTVDFPEAISVDAIPQRQPAWNQTEQGESLPGVIHYSGAEISPVKTYMAAIPSDTNAMTQVQQLQQEKAALRDRLTQIEQALVQLAGLAAGEVGSPEGTIGLQPFEPAQERSESLEAWERSHPAAQRQQILVETLTAQLSSSQERIAQLERDCALTQQRHNEQVQQVLQAENTCRDLRLRLHRQQQQTLQFKAALEKCLEMPTANGYPVIAEMALVDEAATPEALSSLPKNPPVKPWSFAEKTSHDPALPQLLFKRLNHILAEHDVSEAQSTPFSERTEAEMMPMAADQSSLLDPDDPQFVTHLMQMIFPTSAEQPAYVTANVLQSEPLNLSRLETELETALEPKETECTDVDALLTLAASSPVAVVSPDRPADEAMATSSDVQNQHNAVSSSPAAIAGIAPASLPAAPATDPLWDDLATLIDPRPHAECVNPAVAAVDRPNERVDLAQISIIASDSTQRVPLEKPLPMPPGATPIPPIFTADAAPGAALPLAEAAIASSSTAWTWRDRLVSAGKVARPNTRSTDTGSTDTGLTDTGSTDIGSTTTRSTAIERAAQTPKPLALSADQPIVQPPVSASSHTALAPTSFAGPPSPIVYPLRSTRKLASLAAVDLPTFPKR